MDLQGVSQKETSLKKKKEDGEFTPSVEMMVHDYDDERTLEEEEALGPLEDPQVELSSLQKEKDMPLEDLMAMYGYNEVDAPSESSEEANGERSETESTDKPEQSELEQFYADEVDNGTNSTRNVRLRLSEDEEDFEYYPEEEIRKKTIMVGSDYQAWIPELLCKYEDLPYENEDILVWDPSDLLQKDIEAYLIKAQKDKNDHPKQKYPSDDEQALLILMQSGHNIEEALRKILETSASNEVSLSEEECKLFESGLVSYGKRFHLIQQNNVRTRTVRELVEYYYWWKRTEKYDNFMKERLEQSKYEIDPAFTEYMMNPNRTLSPPMPSDLPRSLDDQPLEANVQNDQPSVETEETDGSGSNKYSYEHFKNDIEVISKKKFV